MTGKVEEYKDSLVNALSLSPNAATGCGSIQLPQGIAGILEPQINPDLRTSGLGKVNNPRRNASMHTDSSGDLIDSSGGDSVHPVIPRSSYLL